MTEKVALFGDASSIVGILTEPEACPSDSGLPAAVVLNAGFIHRVGPNRIHVKLARKLASSGYCTLRFDFSGIGDSNSRDDNVPGEMSSIHEIQQAMDYVGSRRGIHRFILMGICSGANIAVKTACRDRRVVGIAAVNGTFMNKVQRYHMNAILEGRIRRRYYRKHLFDHRRWWKLLTGRTDLRRAAQSVVERMQGPRTARRASISPLIDTSAECITLLDRGVHLLLVYSEGSSALDAFRLTLEPGLRPRRSCEKLRIETIDDTDHAFTLLWSQDLLMDRIQEWSCDTWPTAVSGLRADVASSAPAEGKTAERAQAIQQEDCS
jgi:alpha/beta superfamily hydrolase